MAPWCYPYFWTQPQKIYVTESKLWFFGGYVCVGWRPNSILIFLILLFTKPNIEVSGWLYQTKTHITHHVYQPFSRVEVPYYNGWQGFPDTLTFGLTFTIVMSSIDNCLGLTFTPNTDQTKHKMFSKEILCIIPTVTLWHHLWMKKILFFNPQNTFRKRVNC